MDFKARRKEEEEEERGREIPRAALSSCSLAKKSNAKFSLLPLVSRTGMNPAQGKKTFAQISVRPGREEGIYIFPSSGAENEGPAPFLFCPPRPSPFFTPQLFAFLSFLSLSFPAREAILITHEKHCGRRRPTDREEEEGGLFLFASSSLPFSPSAHTLACSRLGGKICNSSSSSSLSRTWRWTAFTFLFLPLPKLYISLVQIKKGASLPFLPTHKNKLLLIL